MRTVKTAPTGTMNFDFDPRYLNEGAYRSAYNMRPLSDAGGSTMTMETVRGTREEFSLGTVPEQDKKVELEFNKAQDVQFGFKVLDENGIVILDGGGSGDLSQIAGQIGEASNTQVSVSGTVATVTFENGKDFRITINDYGDDTELIRNQVVQELLSGPDQTGELYLIGQYEYYDKLFLFSTTSTSANGGVGEIGVVTENPDGSLSYLRGLRSKELKFSTQHPIEATVEETDFRVAVYFTDNFNELRKFAYEAPVSKPDFGLAQNGGRYELGSIKEQMKLIPNTTLPTITFKNQLQAGGILESGTYRYSVRFLTQELEESEWITTTNQIPVFSASTDGNAQDLLGDLPGVQTAKANVVRVSGIDTQRFDFVELAAVHYVDETPKGIIVKRTGITGSQMDITHTGNEDGQRNIGNLASLIDQSINISKAKNISILDNRLFVSNVDFGRKNFSQKLQSIAENINITWNTQALESIGFEQSSFGEYMLPKNCHDKVGYCSGEKYRFGIKFYYGDGTSSPPFHIADSGPPLGGDLAINLQAQVNYPVFSNIDFSDEEVRSEVAGYQIMRVEMDDSLKEVLFSGLALPDNPDGQSIYDGIGEGFGSLDDDVVDDWYINSPDLLYRFHSFDGQRDGDKVFLKAQNVNNKRTPIRAFPQYYDYTGASLTLRQGQVLDAALTSEAKSVITSNPRTDVTLQSGSISRTPAVIFLSEGATSNSNAKYNRLSPGVWVLLNQNFPFPDKDPLVNDNFALPIAYYKRPKVNKFGDPSDSYYIPCQQVVKRESTVEETSVFGGDTFVQKSNVHLHHNLGSDSRGIIVAYFSENRINSQLRAVSEKSETEKIYPQGGQTLEEVLRKNLSDGPVRKHNFAYSFQNEIQKYSGYNPNKGDVEAAETRIYFSQLNPTNSRADRYGEFKPLNYKDLDPNNGPINHMEVANGFLHTWQPRAFSRLYVNMTGLINPEDSTAVLTGSNEVLQKQEKKLSSYGTNHKWSVIKARSQGGNDIVYWYSSDFGKMMRFGGDGSVPISDRDHFSAWFAEEVKGVYKFDTPTHDGGVHGVWDDRFNELLMTFIIPNEDNIVDYTSSALQSAGYLVVQNNGTDADLDIPAGTIIRKDGILYSVTSKVTVAWSSDDAATIVLNYASPSERPSSYEEVGLYNPRAYTVKTIVHSDLKNGFSAYYDVRARIYAPIRNRYISQNPDTLTIDLHNEGNYMQFHGRNFEASAKLPVNYDPSAIKVYRAILVASQDKPSRLEFETDAHETYLTFFDIEEREGYFVAPIPLNSSLDGLNDNDSPYMRGPYLLADVIFEPNQYNNLLNIGTKIVMSPRVYRS